MVMLLVAFFGWWYGRGWAQVAQSFSRRLKGVMDLFSVEQLLRTLFAPWRRIITYPGASLAEKWRAWGDNLFSRVIGFVVRLFVLLAAFASLILIAILTVLEILIWPLLPAAIPGSLVAGLLL
jgi:hypothetical protein